MTDDLKRLGALSAPKPDPSRKAAALAAAMTAYDAEEKKSPAPQGSASGTRPMGILNLIGRLTMNTRLLATSALATLLIVPAAGYVAINFTRDTAPLVNDKGAVPTIADADAKLKKDVPTQEEAELAGSPVKKPVTDATKTTLGGEIATGQADDGASVADELESDAEPLASAAPESKVAVPGRIAGAPAELARRNKDQSAMPKMAEGMVSPDAVVSSEAVAAAEPPADIMVGKPMVDPADGDRFTSDKVNPVKSVATEPVSTFSIDVDTASYAYMRQSITGGQLPDADTVRVEEMINYFPYGWQGPETKDEPFRTNVTVMPTPWNEHTKLMHVAIKGFEATMSEQPRANLVFLIDVSGSMDEPNKLPLLKSAFRLLVNTLRPDDTVSIVTYAGNSGVVLEPTAAKERDKILAAIDNLDPGGSTAGAAGIETAYELAKKAFVKDGTNRVLLATDGDFNVGPSDDEALKRLIEDKRKSGIFLSVLGFGTGNYNDGLMQTLAQNGNGIAAYIDTLSEAQKTLVQEATASLFPIAKDVKIQVEFNPAEIAEYRLIGYETRALNREDFNNDRVDAGEIGAGHSVTAIYEVTPKGSPAQLNDELRYGDKTPASATEAAPSGEIAYVKLRFKKPNEDQSKLITMPVTAANEIKAFDQASVDVRFSVAVAAFGQKLKDEPALDHFGFDKIVAAAEAARGADPFGYRAEFVNLVRLAEGLR